MNLESGPRFADIWKAYLVAKHNYVNCLKKYDGGQKIVLRVGIPPKKYHKKKETSQKNFFLSVFKIP